MKRVKLILLRCTDGQGEAITESVTKDGLGLNEGSHIEDATTTKQLYILLCSEKALYVYSLVHAVQVMNNLLLGIIRNYDYE